ncbi:MAG: hypothetical protein KC464_19680, partial [Myxococcales bacterium]|nr:hypothetical protein [Myxococcales bacterium]
APSTRPAFLIERRGLPRADLATLAKDGYHLLRTTTWTRLVALLFAAYLVINLLVGALLWAGDATILNARPHSFWDRFYFSVETMATIGFGNMAPGDTLSHVVVTVESFVGVLYAALVTGIVFGKFATPTPKVMFSDRCVVADEDGVPTLMFRCANARATAIVEANVRVALTRNEVLPHGERARRIYDLTLRRTTSPLFVLSWTVFHPIDATSPLYGLTAADLARESANLIVTFTGIDDKLASTVHTRHLYAASQIVFGRRFVDILGDDPATGARFIDYRRFHDTTEAPVTLPEATA